MKTVEDMDGRGVWFACIEGQIAEALTPMGLPSSIRYTDTAIQVMLRG
jgi:hypothetical protein